jgi:starch-binding outer membrane protein, SusD/RagB family
MRKISFLFVLGFILTFVFIACEDLNVENTNSPTFEETLDPTLAYDKVGELLNQVHFSSHSWYGLQIGIFCAADAGTSFIRFYGGTGLLISEPRKEFPNITGSGSYYDFESGYRYSYVSLINANDALSSIFNDKNGLVQDAEMCKAVAYYSQAYIIGHLGLLYDKAFIVTNHIDLYENMDYSSYEIMVDSAIAICDKAIEICNANIFTIPQTWLPTNDTYTNVEFGQLVNTLAARLLTYKSRNASQNLANDWAKILEYAENGIQLDYSPIMNDVNWHDYYRFYARRGGFYGIDMRVINLMDPLMHPWFPASGDLKDLPNNGVASSADARLNLDFEFNTHHNAFQERGFYLWSTYRYKRYDYFYNDFIGELPCILKWENDMIRAEALVRTGKLTDAANILNDPLGPRKVRGGLPDVAIVEDDLLSAIYYEKTIECLITTVMTEFYDMRRRDMLQEGTPLHLPIPVEQLELLMIPSYSFGGETGIPGEDYSIGGWDKVAPFYYKSTYGY